MHTVAVKIRDHGNYVSPKSILAMVVGFCIGWVWLYPVFLIPSPIFIESYPNSLWRYARSLSIFYLIPFISLSLATKTLFSIKNVVVNFLFLVFPFLSLAIVPDTKFAIYGCFPVWAAGLSLLILSSLNKNLLNQIIFSASFSIALLFLIGLSTYGIDSSSYYGRSRSHFGFVHPIYSAAAIIGTSYCFYRVARRLLIKAHSLARLLHLLNFAISTYLLFLADSRNSTIAYILFVSSYSIAQLSQAHLWARKTVATGIVIFFLMYTAIAVFTNRSGELFEKMNIASSFRIAHNTDFFHSYINSVSLISLWGETKGLPTKTIIERQTFVSHDSVLITLLSNFGLIFTLLFYFWFLIRGISITNSKDLSKYSAWVTFLFFTMFDAQGITPSNILVFYLFFLIYSGPSEPGHLTNRKRA